MKTEVRNATRGTVLATAADVARTSYERRRGLLGRTHLAPGEALWIRPCEAIHTFFMKFPIDLVYLDRHERVCKLRHSVKPWRMSLCLTARSVLELPAGSIAVSGTEVRDQMEFSGPEIPDPSSRSANQAPA